MPKALPRLSLDQLVVLFLVVLCRWAQVRNVTFLPHTFVVLARHCSDERRKDKTEVEAVVFGVEVARR